MACCGPSRRRLLYLMGAAALVPMARGFPVGAEPAPVVAKDLEVVTVTDTSVIVTWSTCSGQLPVDADTELRIGPADSNAPLRVVVADTTPTPFHFAEVQGLEPGRPYRYEALSRGVRAVPTAAATALPGTPETTGLFVTLIRPSGRYLRTIALSNDIHYGEDVSGLISGDVPPGFDQEPGLPPYPEVMLAAMLDDLRSSDRGADHLIVAGDLTAEATARDSRIVRSRLDSWGQLGRDYFVCRGNHDRPHIGEPYSGCPALPGAEGHHDCWGTEFIDRQHLVTGELGELRLLGIDTTELDGSGGRIDRDQMAEIRDALDRDRDRPTLAFGHHPVTFESAISNPGGPGFVLDRSNSQELQQLYASAPGVFLHHSGHTHRNRRTQPDVAMPVEFIEVGAVKEYPGGYSLLRLYEGGYMLNFYKTRSDLARRWSTRTRGEFYGLFPDYALGTLADRNHVVARDLSGLLPA